MKLAFAVAVIAFMALAEASYHKNYDYRCKVGYHPDPSYCGGFIQCDEWGKEFYFKCPYGLVFNPRINVCDWPRNYHCYGYSTYKQHSYKVHYAKKDYHYCSYKKDGYYGYADDCYSYIHCERGIGYVIRCPKHLVWNTKYNVCDHKSSKYACNNYGYNQNKHHGKYHGKNYHGQYNGKHY